MIQVWFSHVPGTLVVVPCPVVHLDLVHEVKMTQQMTSLLPPAPDCLVGEGLVDDPPRHRPSTAIPIMTVTYLVRFSVYSWVASKIKSLFRGLVLRQVLPYLEDLSR